MKEELSELHARRQTLVIAVKEGTKKKERRRSQTNGIKKEKCCYQCHKYLAVSLVSKLYFHQ